MGRLPIAATITFLAACGTFVAKPTLINPSPRPMVARSPEAVGVYASSPPTRPHVDVALLDCTQTKIAAEPGDKYMISALRQQAAAMGCDAIFIKGPTEHQAERGKLFDTDATNREAVCLVYTDAADTGAVTARPGFTPGQPLKETPNSN